MAKENPTPNLELAPLVPPGPDSFNIHPKAVKAWLAGLPMANSGEAGRMLFEALREVNSLDVDPAQRFEFLETLRRPIHLIVQSLDRHYVGIPFPLPPTNRRIADLAMAFHREMAVGYSYVVIRLGRLRGVAALTRRSMLSAATYRALLCRSRILFKAFQIYAPYPRMVWHELHELYDYARRAGIAAKAIEDSENALVKSRTIEDVYKQALLLALSNPYRLRQGDVIKVRDALELWSPYCRLTAVSQADDHPQGLFAVRGDSDEQPSYLDGVRPSTGLTWVLDTTALGGLLREQDAYLNGTRTKPSKTVLKALPENLPEDLLQRVMLSWGMMVIRGYSRHSTSKTEEVDIALGLSALYYFSGGDERLLFESSGNTTSLTDTSMAEWGSASVRRIEHHTHCCKVLDESAGGYRLSWCVENNLRVQVGELLGVHLPHQRDDQWGVAVVRWMRAQGDDQMEIGIQMLAPSVKPVTGRVCSAEGHCGEHQACLILPAIDGIDQPASLITPNFFHNFATRAMLTDGPRKQVVSFTKTIENTGAFTQFEFKKETGGAVAHPPHPPSSLASIEPLPEAEPVAPPIPEKRKEESEFESIWNDL